MIRWLLLLHVRWLLLLCAWLLQIEIGIHALSVGIDGRKIVSTYTEYNWSQSNKKGKSVARWAHSKWKRKLNSAQFTYHPFHPFEQRT